MVAGKVRIAMGLQKSPSSTNNKTPPPPPSPCPSSGGKPHKTSAFTRSFGAYFPRASAQVQPRPPDVVSELLKLVEDLRESESRLKTELVEQKLLRQTAAIVPLLEADIVSKGDEIHRLLNKIRELEAENEKLVHEREVIKAEFDAERRERDAKIVKLEAEIDEIRQLSASQRMVVKNSSFRKMAKGTNDQGPKLGEAESMRREKEEIIPVVELERPSHSRSNSDEIAGISGSGFSAIVVRSRVPRVPKPPPPKRSSSESSLSSLRPPPPPPPPVKSGAPPPPPPPPPGKCGAPPPPPPPPPPQKRAPPPLPVKGAAAKVKRAPEVVEFYHSLMRRDSRRDAGTGTTETTAANAKDLVGEIQNRSSYLLAIKTDVETQGDFIRFLIKEVETASFTDIEDVISFVKWLDDELSYLVDERAVLKHFNWPEQKADALREAAFEYSDLKKLEFEASSFRVDARQTACSSALKKMQTLLEKLEHAAYNLSRLRESAANRFKSFHIPVDWMLDTGFVSQIKLASVKLAMKYMKRVSAELEAVGGFPDEEELIVQGVRFAFRVHQFAGGFDVETMRAFEELRDKARSCHIHCQNQQQQNQSQRLICRSTMPC